VTAIAISGAGLATSVGTQVDNACAAIQADICAPTPLHDFPVLDADAQEPRPLLAHPIRGFTEGFVSFGRWSRLAHCCFCDLEDQDLVAPRQDTAFWLRTGLVFLTPPLDSLRYFEAHDDPGFAREMACERMAETLALPVPEANIELIDDGPAGLSKALDKAPRQLGRDLDRLLIIAVDSYVDGLSLDWLGLHNRIKCDDNACGLMPGEAGVAVIVERARSGQLTIAAAASDHEPNHFFSGKPCTGEALARSITKALQDAAITDPFGGDLIVNLNGEEWRAREWGHALVRLGRRVDPAARVHLPCSSIGDVGAASALLGVVLAMKAHEFDQAVADATLIVSTSEYGAVSATIVREA